MFVLALTAYVHVFIISLKEVKSDGLEKTEKVGDIFSEINLFAIWVVVNRPIWKIKL